MKTVTLLRHAKASQDSPTFDDRDRPLSERGHEDAALIATEMKGRGHVPDLILCSSARRTQETCQHIARILGEGIEARIESDLYLATDDEILAAAQTTPTEAAHVVVIAHNPGLEELSLTLGRDGAPPKFPTGALAVFRFDVDRWSDVQRGEGTLADYITPKMLRA